MTKRPALALIFAGVLGWVLLSHLWVGNIFAGGDVQWADVVTSEGERRVGTASLKRMGHGTSLSIWTTELEPSSAYAVMLVVANHPELCVSDPCSDADLQNLATRSGVFWVTGGVSNSEGHLQLRVFVPVGWMPLNRTRDGRERMRFGESVLRSKKAWFQPFIWYSGSLSADRGTRLDQIGTRFTGCTGGETCGPVQFMRFSPEEGAN